MRLTNQINHPHLTLSKQLLRIAPCFGSVSVIYRLKTILLTAIFGFIIASCQQSPPLSNSLPDYNTLIEEPRYIENNQLVIDKEWSSKLKINQISTIEDEDLWNNIRESEKLGGSPRDRSQKSVSYQLKKLSNNQHFFDIMGERAAPYLYHITNELKKRGMPLYIALLPIIESGYQVKVTSSQKASGLWQIMPSTGKYLGLKQNWWYDGRHDPIASTNAALNYLEQLHTRFDDWQLALAAYNSGGATISNAIKRNRRLGKSTDYWSLDLPNETQEYIPKLIALETVINSPSSYGIQLVKIPNKPTIRTVDTKGQIQLKKAAELANIDYEKLRALNPGFKRWATDPEGPHQLLIPIESAQQLEYAIAALPQNERVEWQNHKIKSGESLWKIAKKYKISIDLLKRTNHLKTNHLRIGRNLLIPTGSTPEAIVASSSENRTELPVLKNNTYRVKSGDSLWLIARRFDLHVQQILEWNDLNKNKALKPGKKLKIFLEKPILEAASL